MRSPGRYPSSAPLGTKGRDLNALVDDGRDVVDHRNEQEQSKSKSNGVMFAFDPEMSAYHRRFKVSNFAQSPLRAGSTVRCRIATRKADEGAMDNFIERLNIAHYLEQLKTVTDPIKREMLQQLLVEEKAKQVSHANVEK
jgi:hypothetical protein